MADKRSEKLKAAAIQYAVDYPTSYGKGYKRVDLRKAYIAGAESREPEIGKLEGRLEDERMEYIELENFMNNKVNEAKGIIEKLLHYMNPIIAIKSEEDRNKAISEAEEFLSRKE